MDNLETICNDSTAWVGFESKYGSAKIYTRCQCGRYLKHGDVLVTVEGVKFQGWTCKKCGEIEPFHLID